MKLVICMAKKAEIRGVVCKSGELVKSGEVSSKNILKGFKGCFFAFINNNLSMVNGCLIKKEM